MKNKNRKSVLFGFMGFMLMVASIVIYAATPTPAQAKDPLQAGACNAKALGVESKSTFMIEQAVTECIQRKLISLQPQPTITTSLERANLIERFRRFNDPNKISYLWALSEDGTILTMYPIKGKVSGMDSLLSNPEQLLDDPHGNYDSGSRVVSAPQEDGSYGSNDPNAIFFFTVDGVFVQYNGLYLLTDTEMTVTSQPVLIYNVKE